ncbi:MAG: CDP-alcohol phosphatidyltransferase family protein [Bdellovibrionales bacterium]
MIDGPFRQLLPLYSKKIVRLYSYFKLTPNTITWFAFIISVFACVAIVRSQNILALILWWLGRLLDGTDGIYARATEQTSKLGAYLDILLDMASYSLVVLAFSIVYPEFQVEWNTILFLYVLCITGALSLGAFEREINKTDSDNRGLKLASGLAEGGETGIAYSIFLLFPRLMPFSLWLWIAILAVTVVARLILARRKLA